MYKGASANLQRHARGFIMSEDDANELPDISQMSEAEATMERDQLRIELARCDQELTILRAQKKPRRSLGFARQPFNPGLRL